MKALKTRPEKTSVAGFLAAIEPESRRAECRKVARLMQQVTGAKPQMWGTSIVGFGTRTYQGASGQTPWFLAGFSPRKAALTLYIMGGVEAYPALLKRLGKHTTGRACLYLKSLDGVDMDALKELIETSVRTVRES